MDAGLNAAQSMAKQRLSGKKGSGGGGSSGGSGKKVGNSDTRFTSNTLGLTLVTLGINRSVVPTVCHYFS